MRLKDKVAVITGGSGGIGRGIALKMAKEGAHIAALDIDDAGGAETVRQVKALGRRATYVKADLTKHANVQAALDRVVKELGGFDILVNTAGISRPTPFLDLEEDNWDLMFAVNLKSHYLTSRVAGKWWVANNRRGKIINISSIDGELPFANMAHYCSTKAGVQMLTKCAALALAPHHINVNCISPGIIIDGGIIQKHIQQDPRMADYHNARQVWGRAGASSEIGDAAVFLASDEAEFITGVVLPVDGGRLLDPLKPPRPS